MEALRSRRWRWLVGSAMALGLVLTVLGCGESSHGGGSSRSTSARGVAFNFGPQGGAVADGEVSILEMPDRVTRTDGGGEFAFDDLPVGSQASFVLRADGRPEIQTATFLLGDSPLEGVSFQSPDDTMVALLALLVGAAPRADRCQLAATVTRANPELVAGKTHGEPGATVTIDPTPAEADGPIYFNLITWNAIWPDRRLSATTDDGGVLYVNVTPGTYRLRAHKAGVMFRDVAVTCRAGIVANAAPPWGLQAE